LFATLTKTAGVCTNNSHSGTHRSRNYLCHRLPTVHRRTHVLSFHTLAHSFALFCTFLRLAESQLLYFQAIPHSSSKDEAFAPAASALRPTLNPIFIPRITEHGPRTTSHKFSRRRALPLCSTGHGTQGTHHCCPVAAFPAECYDLVFHDPR
jgi:hypothetical protein